MRDNTPIQRLIWGLVSGLLVAAPFASGCDLLRRELFQNCDDAEESYQQALEREATKLESPSALPERKKRPAHFGLTLSNDLLTRLANVAVEPLLKSALKIASTVEIQGQSVDVRTEGDVLDLGLAAHGACDHCFQLQTDLGGGLIADIPALGQKRANLGGNFQFVVPLFLAPGDKKSVAVKLDLEKFADYGATNFNPRLSGISSDLESLLRGPLSRLLKNAVDDNFKDAVTLLEFNGPSFGLDDFELTPVVLQSDDDHGSVFAGFSANVAALNEESIPSVASITELAPDQNIALSFQPKLVLHILSLLIGADDVARRYTSGGEADSSGPFHVTLDAFNANRRRAGPVGAGEDALDDASPSSVEAGDRASPTGDADVDSPTTAGSESTQFGLGFTVHRLSGQGFCFSAGARATGDAAVRKEALSIGISDVKFTSDSVPSGVVDIANWTTAQFVRETESLVQKSIEGDNLKVPGTSLGVGPVALDLRPNTFVLRGRSKLEESSESQ